MFRWLLHEPDFIAWNVSSEDAYDQDSAQRRNAEHFAVSGWSGQKLPLHFGTRATRDILKDEEIFVSYGFGYWLTRKYAGDEDAAAAAADAHYSAAVAKPALKGFGSKDDKMQKKKRTRSTK